MSILLVTSDKIPVSKCHDKHNTVIKSLKYSMISVGFKSLEKHPIANRKL